MIKNKSIHCKLGVVDALGNVVLLSPHTTGSDVILRDNGRGSGTDLQTLVNNLSEVAFDKVFLGIDDSLINSENQSWSANKIVRDVRNIRKNNSGVADTFIDKCNTIAEGISSNGVTAEGTDSPTVLGQKMATVYSNKYNDGNTAGINATKKGDAVAGNVLSGLTFTSASAGVGVAGTIANKGSLNTLVEYGSSVTIPAGYYSSCIVRARNIATATSSKATYDVYYSGQTKTLTIALGRTASNIKILGVFLATFSINVYDYNSSYHSYGGIEVTPSISVGSGSYSSLNCTLTFTRISGSFDDAMCNLSVKVVYAYE